MTFVTKDARETMLLGEKIGFLLQPGDVLALTGTLAAGKTTLTKGIAKALGIEDDITSPTFCLISEYEGKKMPLYHMDVYRLDGAEDFAGLGADDMLYGNGACVIEWSEKVQSALPRKSVLIEITPNADGSRCICIQNWKNGTIGWKEDGQ